MRCDELHEPGGSSFGAQYGYRGNTTFTDRVTFVGTCKEHTPLIRASLLDEAMSCAANESCALASPDRARSLRPAAPLTYGCAYTVYEYVGTSANMTTTELTALFPER